MTDDLVKRLRENFHDGFKKANPAGALVIYEMERREAAARIEQLEAALREIACDGEDCHCQAPQYCSYGIARLALGEKKDG